MSILKTIGLFYFLVAISAVHAALRDHVTTVQKGCPNTSTLLIKKSAVELSSIANCDQSFTEKLLQGCSNMDCAQLMNSFKNNLQDRTGSVVGE